MALGRTSRAIPSSTPKYNTAPDATPPPSEGKEEKKAVSFYADALQAATEAHINAPTSSKNGKKRAELLQAALHAATTPEEVNTVITQRLQRTISRPFQKKKKRNKLGPHSLDTRILNQLCGNKIGSDKSVRKYMRDNLIYMLLPIDYSDVFEINSPHLYWRWGLKSSSSILEETFARLFMEKADKSDAQKFTTDLLTMHTDISVIQHIPALLQLLPILSPTQKTDITHKVMETLRNHYHVILQEKDFDQAYKLLTLINPDKINLLFQELLQIPLENQSYEDSWLAFYLAHKLKHNKTIARERFLYVIQKRGGAYLYDLYMEDFPYDLFAGHQFLENLNLLLARHQFFEKLNLSKEEMKIILRNAKIFGSDGYYRSKFHAVIIVSLVAEYAQYIDLEDRELLDHLLRFTILGDVSFKHNWATQLRKNLNPAVLAEYRTHPALTITPESTPPLPDDKKHESKPSSTEENSTDLFQIARHLIKTPDDEKTLKSLSAKPLHVQEEFLHYLRLAKDEYLMHPLRNNFENNLSRTDHKLRVYLAYERIRHSLSPKMTQSHLLVHSIFSTNQPPLNLVLDYLEMPRCTPGFSNQT